MMKTVTCLALLLAASLLSGCRIVNQAQYQIAGSTRSEGLQAVVTAEHRQAVKAVLAETAAKLRFQDLTGQSLVPDVIGYWQQQETDIPIRLLARVVNDRVVIDLMHYPMPTGETLDYRAAKDLLLAELRAKFRGKVVVAPMNSRIEPPTSVTP